MGAPIDRTAKAAMDLNLVNGVASDAPKLKASDNVLYDYVDGLNSAQDAHAQAATLAHPDGSVKTTKIADGAVTTAKLAELSVTTSKIALGAVGAAQLATSGTVNESVNNVLITALKADVAQRAVNVKSAPYNATGGGVAEDTDSFNQAISDMNALGGGSVIVPQGTYMIDAVTKSIVMKSNVSLLLAKGAVIKAIPNSSDSYKIIKCSSITNFSIIGGTIQGERTSHVGSTGEFGMGINIDTCSDFLISNLTVKDCWGDGLYLGAGATTWNENGKIENVTCDNNRRQGISVISAKDLDILNARLINTNGTAPEGGLDLEPNYVGQKMEGVRVTNLYTYNNAGRGLAIGCGVIPHVDIVVDNHYDDAKDGIGPSVTFATTETTQTGKIVIMNPTWKNTLVAPCSVRNYSSRGARVEIHSPTIVDCNRAGTVGSKYYSAFSIISETTDTGDYAIGNIHIFRANILASGLAKIDRPIYAVSDKTTVTGTVKVENISFVDPVNLSGATTPNTVHVQNPGSDKIFVRDMYGLLIDNSNADATVSGSTLKPTFILPSTATANRTKTVSSTIPTGFEITFENQGSVRTLIISVGATGRVYPDMTAAGQTLQLVGIGSRVTIKRIGTDIWVIVNKIGTVNVV